jgi:hypothetical protein
VDPKDYIAIIAGPKDLHEATQYRDPADYHEATQQIQMANMRL